MGSSVLFFPQENKAKDGFHSEEEKQSFLEQFRSPIGPGDHFLPSHRCRGCHGFDTLAHASLDANGVDINLFDDWRATMMANSARDPLWRAKVSHEMLVNPAHAVALQDKCTSCHAPLGKYNALFKGNPHFGLADIDNDTLGVDGVSCGGCHAIGDTPLGNMFSGNIPYDSTRKEYGPFTLPMIGPMQLYEGLIPTYSPHISESKVCSHCHTLITETADLLGNSTGGEFVEQATFHEWLNSGYSADNVTCQSCHMPEITSGVVIANEQLGLQPRSPFNQHQFAGANIFMLKLMKANRQSLNIPAENKNFDSTIVSTENLLKQKTANLDVTLDSITPDTAFIKVEVKNKAGHKLPSGYPSRRMVVQLFVTNNVGDTLFQSGRFNQDYTVTGENSPFEPHHQIINQANQNQIYEMVMGDVNSNFTTVLERAAVLLKDNRIPPEGFTTQHAAYDTAKISADALADLNFNRYNPTSQGSGRDFVFYHIPLNEATGTISIFTNLYYQAVPPKWTQEMFSLSSPQIDTFRNLFNAADQSPFLIGSDSLTGVNLVTVITRTNEKELRIWPNPSPEGYVWIDSPAKPVTQLRIFDSAGNLIQNLDFLKGQKAVKVNLPEEKGIYFLKIKTGKDVVLKRVVRN